MKKLIKTVEGADCKIFGIKNHQRYLIANATPRIEIYQNITSVNVLGKNTSQIKTYEFSLIICPDPEIDSRIDCDILNDVGCFDLTMFLKRKDDVFVPFEFRGLANFDIDQYEDWVFRVDDLEVTKELIVL